MEQYLGKDWQQRYPATLTKQEKADIRSALLMALSKTTPFRESLKSYLETIHLLSIYPEEVHNQFPSQ